MLIDCSVLDCNTYTTPFVPRFVIQSSEPIPASGELLMWRDSDDLKTYLVFGDPAYGGRIVELT